MPFLRDITIRRKLTLIIMAVSITVLLLASCAYIGYEQMMLRKELVNTIAVDAKIIGENCKAAITFADAEDAQETLASLQAVPSFVFACIYTPQGKILAQYQNSLIQEVLQPPVMEHGGWRFEEGHLLLFEQITHDGEVIGSIYIKSHLGELDAMFKQNPLVFGILIVLSSLVAYALATRLQKVFSEPILALARTAKSITTEQNLVRCDIPHGQDEIGVLIDSFNEMLDQLQDRQAALHESEEKFRTLYESSSDAVMLRDADGFFDCNASTLEIFGYDKLSEFQGKFPTDFSPATQSNGQDSVTLARQYIDTAYKRGSVRFEWTYCKKDGTKFPAEVLNTIVELKGRKIIQSVVHDITQRKKAEDEIRKLNEDLEQRVKERTAELEETHLKLLEASRQAGMAEVATDVLHNVGNVLNSINVSTELLTEMVRSSEVTNLKKVTDLIEDHSNDLADYLTQNNQGKHIPALLIEMGKHLTAESEKTVEELKGLSDNVEHVKTIVQMQQSYAKVSGIEAPTHLSESIKSSLDINLAALERHQVKVATEIEELPELVTDKQKVIQILVNLINNAKYALGENDDKERLLTIRLYRYENDRIRIEVSDNGVGIPEENLDRIFRHGFTTKAQGHGFGLHSGALAANELGGSLTVQSEGPGKGSTFTLELPFKISEVTQWKMQAAKKTDAS
ncbi:MAG: PAS domain S-box protein [Planctomycetes bacterium]|nr:PAS domain S-box protein [Planctomycetota bacterium]